MQRWETPSESVPTGPTREGRRAFLTKLGIGGATTWAAPVILSRPAGAGPGTGLIPEFLPGSTANDNNAGAANTVSVSRPAAVLTGSLVLAAVCCSPDQTISSFTPAGWTQIGTITAGSDGAFGDGVRLTVFARTAQPGDAAYSFTKSSFAGGAMTMSVAAYAGIGTPVVAQTVTSPQPSGTTKTFPAATWVADRLFVRVGAGSNWAGFGTQAWQGGFAPTADIRVNSAGYGGALGVGIGSRCITIADHLQSSTTARVINRNRPAVTCTIGLDDLG